LLVVDQPDKIAHSLVLLLVVQLARSLVGSQQAARVVLWQAPLLVQQQALSSALQLLRAAGTIHIMDVFASADKRTEKPPQDGGFFIARKKSEVSEQRLRSDPMQSMQERATLQGPSIRHALSRLGAQRFDQ
jgi:hypothetical protein